jgi:leucyl-tRNA synthetase
VTEDIEELRLNTGISAMMEFVNGAIKWESVPTAALETFSLLLSPFAPHIAEELWQVRTTSGSPEAACYESQGRTGI